jgi:hypothetical protein
MCHALAAKGLRGLSPTRSLREDTVSSGGQTTWAINVHCRAALESRLYRLISSNWCDFRLFDSNAEALGDFAHGQAGVELG